MRVWCFSNLRATVTPFNLSSLLPWPSAPLELCLLMWWMIFCSIWSKIPLLFLDLNANLVPFICIHGGVPQGSLLGPLPFFLSFFIRVFHLLDKFYTVMELISTSTLMILSSMCLQTQMISPQLPNEKWELYVMLFSAKILIKLRCWRLVLLDKDTSTTKLLSHVMIYNFT